MAQAGLIGSRIRERRVALGRRQSALAKACGISPSYLNLIEHNRRNIGGKLLGNIARALDTDVAALGQGASGSMVDALHLAAANLEEAGAEAERAEDFAGRFPGWAALVAEQGRRIRSLEDNVAMLSDRLRHDPALAEAVHDMLSTITGIHSASAILNDSSDVDPEWQARFHRNIHEDSARLSEASQALVTHLDRAGEDDLASVSPREAVQSWLARKRYRIAALEADPGADIEAMLAEELETAAARDVARAMLDRYRADIRAVPMAALEAATVRGVEDPAALARAFGVGLGRMFRRLATLPETPTRPAFGLVVCDASGEITYRKSVDGFVMARHGGACPLWPLFAVLGRPAQPLRESIRTQGRDGRAFTTFSIAEPAQTPGFEGPVLFEASMLIMPRAHDAGPQPDRAVGMTCRRCAAPDCPARREPSLLTDRAF